MIYYSGRDFCNVTKNTLSISCLEEIKRVKLTCPNQWEIFMRAFMTGIMPSQGMLEIFLFISHAYNTSANLNDLYFRIEVMRKR